MKRIVLFPIKLLLIPLVLMTVCCSEKGAPAPPQQPPSDCVYLGVDTCKTMEKSVVMVDLDNVKQTIHSFGGSDCWTTKFIGQWPDEAKKNKIADLLFSTDTLSDGTPEGIGLSMWRFNIGSGSYEQGALSGIATDWRREECFLNEDGTYNWDKQKGQQWFLEAAKQRGVEYTLGFSLSPPVYMTKNGKAFNGSGGTKMNIKKGMMENYADFLAKVAHHFEFDYLSPVNEPQWTWGNSNGASQEGSQAENQEVAALTRLLSEKLGEQSSVTKVTIAEAGSWTYLYENNHDGRGDQINQFFSPSSVNYVGNLSNVAPVISGHSYWTTCPDNLIDVRQKLADRISQVDPSLGLWQSEFGILGDICGEYNGSPRNTSIDYGLYVAKVLHHDFTVASTSSWSWWLSISPYNYSDALVYINAPNGMINVDHTKADGVVLASKQLWALGNFSRFIRPGMQRVTAAVEGIERPIEAAQTLMVSAYKDKAKNKIVVVVVNFENDKKILQLTNDISGLKFSNNTVKVYTTDAEHSLHKSVAPADNIKIMPRSVVTIIGTYL